MKIEIDVQTGAVRIRFADQDDLAAHTENFETMVAHNDEHTVGEEPHLLYIILPENHPQNDDSGFHRTVSFRDELIPIKNCESEADALQRVNGGEK